jgi:hypothetical protein
MKLVIYITLCAFLFALLDWKVIHLTRFSHPEYKEWMHAHERTYSNIIRPLEYILCTPALAIKEHFYLALVSTEATQEEQDAILHFPYSGNPLLPDGANFWVLVNREAGWKRVSFAAWYLSWLPYILIWWMFVRKHFERITEWMN